MNHNRQIELDSSSQNNKSTEAGFPEAIQTLCCSEMPWDVLASSEEAHKISHDFN